MEENWTGNSQPRSQWFCAKRFIRMKKRCSFQHQSSPFSYSAHYKLNFQKKSQQKGQSALLSKEVSVLAPESLQHNIIVRFPFGGLLKIAAQTLSRVASGKSTFA